MSIILFFIDILFLFWIIRNTLFWVALWQTKEYRFDRLIVHFKETRQGRGVLFSPLAILKWIALFVYGFVIWQTVPLLTYQFFVSVLFILQGFLVFKEFSGHVLKRPVLTHKAIIIVSLSLTVIFLLFFFPLLFEQLFWLLILDRLLPLVVLFFVVMLSFPTEFYQDLQIQKAMKKIRENKKLLVIGVTGSYGKSSTKEYIAQILGKKFRVLKTKGTNNTPIGIANTILSGLQKNTEIFVVEMGAYKRGEIAQMCEMVYPKIGVLTAVNDQHLSLFGSLENTMKAKYELIDALPKGGLALFNGNNSNACLLYEKTKTKKALYASSKSVPADILASHVMVEKTHVTFRILLKKKSLQMKTPLIGAHTIENILPAVYIADYLGMLASEIKEAVAALIPLPKTMVRYESAGISIIDDTFNTNPEAVVAALQYMKIYKGKKIMVFQPMIELGIEAKAEHYRIGKAIGTMCDYLLLTNNNYYTEIHNGIKSTKRKCIVKTGGSVAHIVALINNFAKRGDVLVFEGKEAGLVLEKML